jgi:hypothetical protein
LGSFGRHGTDVADQNIVIQTDHMNEEELMADGTAVPKTATSTVRKPSAPTKQRLNLDLAPVAYEQLRQLADETGKSMAEVLRTGLALYAIAQDAKNSGQSLSVTADGKVTKEILLT